MVVARVNLKKVQEVINKSKEELIDVLFELGLEYDGEDGDYILFDVGTERPDLYSTTGVIRLLKSYYGLEKRELKAKISDKYIIAKPPKYRPYILGFICKNIKIDEDLLEELIYLQEKFHQTIGRNRRKASIGIYRNKLLKYPLIYTTDKLENIKFAPLGFEEIMTGNEIIEKHPKGIEYKHLIKSEETPIFKDSDGKILSLPPIINSNDVGNVQVGDEEVLVELTGTHLPTMNWLASCLAMVLIEHGGEIEILKIKYDNSEDNMDFSYKEVSFDLNKCNEILGLNISKDEALTLLEKFDYKISDEKIFAPPYRYDIYCDVDVYEDVMRAYGINSIEPKLPEIFTIGKQKTENYIINQIRDSLANLGFIEVMTFSLTTIEKQTSKILCNFKMPKLEHLKCGANTIRRNLFPELLEYLYKNKDFPKPTKIFELEYVVNEKLENELHLCCMIYGNSTYTEIRQVLEYVLNKLCFEYEIKRENYPWYLEGRSAKISEIGHIGEIHPQVLNNFDLEYPVAMFEINISKILETLRK
jgi:phenylalanyl-tRNA synthetase beta chain